MKRRKTLLVLYSIILTAFTVYFLLDTFVIERVYSAETVSAQSQVQTQQEVSDETESTNKSEKESKGKHGRKSKSAPYESGETAGAPSDQSGSKSAEPEKSAEPAVTDTSYSDENISVQLGEYRVGNTTVYVADVKLSSAEYLKTALAKGAYGKNVTDTTSNMAANAGAILAINGDYYGSQEKGYVIRNGVLYRSTAVSGKQDLVIYEDGSFEIISEGSVTAEELLAKGAMQVLSFGPGIVENGQVSVSTGYEVAKAMNDNPRTAIGIIDDLHYVFVVSDGRTSESEGLSVYELATFMQSLGVKTAYNLDGGGSSAMYFGGSIVNNPTTNGRTIKERSVSDIVYIGY